MITSAEIAEIAEKQKQKDEAFKVLKAAFDALPDLPLTEDEVTDLYLIYSFFKKDPTFKHYITGMTKAYNSSVAKDVNVEFLKDLVELMAKYNL